MFCTHVYDYVLLSILGIYLKGVPYIVIGDLWFDMHILLILTTLFEVWVSC